MLAVFRGHGAIMYSDVFGFLEVVSSWVLPGSDWFLCKNFPLNRHEDDIASHNSGSGSVSEEDLDLQFQ